jgi:HD-GYP domain-containing protein (c-di-GMP phosphodiesterase class II)
MSETASVVYEEDLFIAVPIASLIHRKTAGSDMFVRLSSERMVKVAHKGGAIDVERIERFGEKNVRYLYVYKQDFAGIVSDLVRGAEGLNQLPNVPTDLKMAKFFSIAESVYSELLNLPVSDESLNRAARLATEISATMREKPDFAHLLATLVSLGDEFARHSLGTVVVSNLLMAQLEWSSQKLVGPITMGAFFHDIGLKEVPEELHFKPHVNMNKEEAALWETHPALGVRLLSPLSFVTPDVLRIVGEHHEIPNGTGFPGRLRLDRIFPMAKLVSFANQMAHDLFPPTGQHQPLSMPHMAQKVQHVYSQMYGTDLTKAARRIFKSDD